MHLGVAGVRQPRRRTWLGKYCVLRSARVRRVAVNAAVNGQLSRAGADKTVLGAGVRREEGTYSALRCAACGAVRDAGLRGVT
jgi:hypothetical protein